MGITIFDISNVSHVQYCFVNCYGTKGEREVPGMTPLPAVFYLAAYYEKPKMELDFASLLANFEEHSVVTTEALACTWAEGD